MSNHPYLHDDGSMGPVDPDIETVVALIGGDLSRDQVDVFKQRIATDPALWRKVGPLMSGVALLVRPDLDAARESFTAGLREHYDRVRDEVLEESRRAPSGGGPVPPDDTTIVPPVAKADAHGRWDRPGKRWPRWVAVGGLVAVSLLVREFYRAYFKVPILATVPTFFGVFAQDETDAYGKQVNEYRLRGLSLPYGTGELLVDSTGAEGAFLREPVGFAYIQPHSRLSYRSSESITELLGSMGRYHASIDGDVALNTMAGDAVIDSPHWEIHLRRLTIVGLRHIAGSDTVYVAVNQGSATARPIGGGQSVDLVRGQFVLLPDLGPAVFRPNDAGFPSAVIPNGFPKNDRLRVH